MSARELFFQHAAKPMADMMRLLLRHSCHYRTPEQCNTLFDDYDGLIITPLPGTSVGSSDDAARREALTRVRTVKLKFSEDLPLGDPREWDPDNVSAFLAEHDLCPAPPVPAEDMVLLARHMIEVKSLFAYMIFISKLNEGEMAKLCANEMTFEDLWEKKERTWWGGASLTLP